MMSASALVSADGKRMVWSIFLVPFDVDFGVRLSVLASTGDRSGEGELSPLHNQVGPSFGIGRTPPAHARGHIDALSLCAAQSVGLLSTTQSAGTIVGKRG